MPATREAQNTFMRSGTRRKFKRIAELDRRNLVSTYDVIADEALRSRGIDPETLKPVKPKS